MPRPLAAILWALLAVLVSGLVPHLHIPLWACAVFGIGVAYFRSILLFHGVVLAMRRGPRHYYDRDGVLRHRGTRRKVRSDRGTVRPHPARCAHCAMVDQWRQVAAADIDAQGGWRNELARPLTPFGAWLRLYYAHQRAAAAA